MAAVADQIEKPAVRLLADGASDELVALASIAITLKRLADTHDGTAANIPIDDTIFGGKAHD